MSERYDLIRAAYDPVRAEQLRGVVRAELRDVAPFEQKQDIVAPPEEVEVLTRNSIKSKRGTRVLVMAAAVAVVGGRRGHAPGLEAPPSSAVAAFEAAGVPAQGAGLPRRARAGVADLEAAGDHRHLSVLVRQPLQLASA